MRVISGSAKGRKLKMLPRGGGTRPITDRGKESLFNILGKTIVEATFLDLFAGTGSVGIEALSRGAAKACFVEQVNPALKVIRSNLKHTCLDQKAQVVRNDVFNYLKLVPRPFDIVFIAPPQFHDLWSKTLIAIDQKPEWLSSSGIAIVQIDPSEFKVLELRHLTLIDRRQYSNVTFCFYRQLCE